MNVINDRVSAYIGLGECNVMVRCRTECMGECTCWVG